MNSENKAELKRRLASMAAKDRRELQRRAAERRAVAQSTAKHAVGSVEDWTLRLLAEEGSGAPPCRVYGVSSTVAWLGGEPVPLTPGVRPVVGDLVVVERGRVVRVLPRQTELTRGETGERQVIAANIDVVVIVVSVVTPPLHPRLIDRCLVSVREGGAAPLVCVNKVDLLPDDVRDEELGKLRPYAEAGVPVVVASAETGDGLDALRAAISGKRVAFLGHSGVGKSTLVNALRADADAQTTGAVSAKSGRGRHTTTASASFTLPDGTEVIDTPGIRAFGIDAAAAMTGFPELAALAPACRFANCRHLEEAGCAVRRAVAEGRVSRERYANFRRLQDHGPPSASEGFRCVECGMAVGTHASGTRHRNHCPQCLCSRHLDARPGDRAAGCGGTMDPVAVWVRDGGEWAVIHRCRECGTMGSNRIAADDNERLLLSIAARPMARPPIPLDRVAAP